MKNWNNTDVPQAVGSKICIRHTHHCAAFKNWFQKYLMTWKNNCHVHTYIHTVKKAENSIYNTILIVYKIWIFINFMGFLGCNSGKEPASQCRRPKRCGFNPWVGKISRKRAWHPTPVFSPGEAHGQRGLAGYSPWGRRVRHDWSNLAQHST